ncbi:hypothetical protein L6164_003510 [Bauhinia variegata]|uniref:Uncharacterized protein n=1 Tax=Bauhinia variegata TaxID=167791 RepID=A0ACB9Q1P7_BAUVA|nr:hypothetical protein L6164_003510 [Bauhinia variegata]
MNASIRQSQSPTKGNNKDDDSNPFGLSGSTLRSQHKRKENMGKFCSSLATLTFALFMLLTILGHPPKEKQGSIISILVSLLAVFNLIAFIFSVSVMILVRWQFTSLQIATMQISAMAIRVAHSNLVISVLFMLMEAPILAMLSLLWNS